MLIQGMLTPGMGQTQGPVRSVEKEAILQNLYDVPLFTEVQKDRRSVKREEVFFFAYVR